MGFCGFFNAYILRVNLSVAIVAMTEDRTVTTENGTEINIVRILLVYPIKNVLQFIVLQGPEFEWSNELQGHILSAFFYGYIATQFAGGLLAAKIGGKLLFGLGVVVTAAFTLITPWLVVANVYLLIAVRVIEGIFEVCVLRRFECD